MFILASKFIHSIVKHHVLILKILYSNNHWMVGTFGLLVNYNRQIYVILDIIYTCYIYFIYRNALCNIVCLFIKLITLGGMELWTEADSVLKEVLDVEKERGFMFSELTTLKIYRYSRNTWLEVDNPEKLQTYLKKGFLFLKLTTLKIYRYSRNTCLEVDNPKNFLFSELITL